MDAHAIVYWNDGGMGRDELQENNTEAVHIALLADLVSEVIPAQGMSRNIPFPYKIMLV